MRYGDVTIPETRCERLIDRARHLVHRFRLPWRPGPPESWDPPLLELLLLALLDDD